MTLLWQRFREASITSNSKHKLTVVGGVVHTVCGFHRCRNFVEERMRACLDDHEIGVERAC
jgi:hypothetical protein